MGLLDHIPTELKRVAGTNGGEYKGPCPWCGGRDRFTVSPEKGDSGLFYCRGCGMGGDGIAFLREYHGLSFSEACGRLRLDDKVVHVNRAHRSLQERPDSLAIERKTELRRVLQPPGKPWQEKARTVVETSQSALWMSGGETARAWLRLRGLRDETIRAAGLGLNVVDEYPLRVSWGLPARPRKQDGGKIWLPRGIVIPWLIDDQLWKVNIRRPNGDLEANDKKYIQAAGSTDAWSTNGLYNADELHTDKPAIIVEGELDTLSIGQAAGDLITPVATGSTHGARKIRWLAKLALCPSVLVAFDCDNPGEDAANYWINALPNARRWRPYWGDASQLLQDGVDVAIWIATGLGNEDH